MEKEDRKRERGKERGKEDAEKNLDSDVTSVDEVKMVRRNQRSLKRTAKTKKGEGEMLEISKHDSFCVRKWVGDKKNERAKRKGKKYDGEKMKERWKDQCDERNKNNRR